jgi:hypothetical protein
MKAYAVRPTATIVELYTATGEGAVLDVPFKFDLRGELLDMPYYLFMSAFHQRPVAACYNSFRLPIQAEIEALANRLPSIQAADALYALGFRTVVVHEEILESTAQSTLGSTRLVEAGRVPHHRAYRLTSPLPVEASFGALAVGKDAGEIAKAVPPESLLAFTFRNQSAATYRHPQPIEPTPLMVRWYSMSGEVVAEHNVRMLLPLALAPDDDVARAITVPVPPVYGEHIVTLAPSVTPDLMITKLTVRVMTQEAVDGDKL